MKRISKKNQYISELIYTRDHFVQELKELAEKNAKAKKAKKRQAYFVHYLGEAFTKFAAERRIEEIDNELARINDEPNYKPWKDEDIVEVDKKPVKREDLKEAMREASQKVFGDQGPVSGGTVVEREGNKMVVTLDKKPKEMCPTDFKYRETVDWYKASLQRIVEQLVWCQYKSPSDSDLEMNVAFEALKELAQEQQRIKTEEGE